MPLGIIGYCLWQVSSHSVLGTDRLKEVAFLMQNGVSWNQESDEKILNEWLTVSQTPDTALCSQYHVDLAMAGETVVFLKEGCGIMVVRTQNLLDRS